MFYEPNSALAEFGASKNIRNTTQLGKPSTVPSEYNWL
jgi:hypothetical protein